MEQINGSLQQPVVEEMDSSNKALNQNDQHILLPKSLPKNQKSKSFQPKYNLQNALPEDVVFLVPKKSNSASKVPKSLTGAQKPSPSPKTLL